MSTVFPDFSGLSREIKRTNTTGDPLEQIHKGA